MENFQKSTDKLLLSLNEKPRLLLHSCCAPCSSYCLEYLTNFFEITVFFYNPNISSEEEYKLRLSEERRFISEAYPDGSVGLIDGGYRHQDFLSAIMGLESLGERSQRCYACYSLRLKKTAETAKDEGFSYFCTTLTVSPLKNAGWLNEIGSSLSTEGCVFLPSDFKKNNGYLRSIELSKKYGLYRQNFCGCEFSK